MTTVLSIIFLVSSFLIWYFIKKKPDKKKRNVAIVFLLFISILLWATTSPSHSTNSKSKILENSKSSPSKQTDSKSPQRSNDKPKKDNNKKKSDTSNIEKANELKSFAKSFGLKDAETVQNMVGSSYSSSTIDGNLGFGWKTKYGTLIRLDDKDDQTTSVYLYDEKSSTKLGDVLYSGHTIYQKPPKVYNFYN